MGRKESKEDMQRRFASCSARGTDTEQLLDLGFKLGESSGKRKGEFSVQGLPDGWRCLSGGFGWTVLVDKKGYRRFNFNWATEPRTLTLRNRYGLTLVYTLGLLAGVGRAPAHDTGLEGLEHVQYGVALSAESAPYLPELWRSADVEGDTEELRFAAAKALREVLCDVETGWASMWHRDLTQHEVNLLSMAEARWLKEGSPAPSR